MITELPAHPDARSAEPFANDDHPMRKVTREVAFEQAWTPSRAARVAELFDSMAADWSSDHVDSVKAAPLLDAIDRGGAPSNGLWVELGCGTGAGAFALRGRVERHVGFDLAFDMLRHGPDWSAKAQADSAALPLPDDSCDVVLLINMLLFPTEVDRVLRPAGRVVWVSTLDDQTPIYLPPDEVADALPGAWDGTTARAGTGRWTVLQRA